VEEIMMSSPSLDSNLKERATIRKLKIRLLPFLFALYVVAFIDRINLGFAALTMNQELAITASSSDSRQEFSFGAIFCSRSPAISFFTRLVHVRGSHAF
jgi:ACS family tartrate transporter-like MFS transporter